MSVFGEIDLYLAGEGRHERLYDVLGAHVREEGVSFAVWAPNARAVAVVGDFNDWQPGAHPLVAREDGTLAVTLNLPPEHSYGFRYLAAGDYWFDDEHADAHDGHNSILHT